MTSLLNYAEQVKLIVENTDRYAHLTQEELDALHTYQFSQPTSPKPGFRYKREYWKIPGDDLVWTGMVEGHTRWAIGHNLKLEGFYYDGPLESVWYVYTCVADPKDDKYVCHEPKEVKVI